MGEGESATVARRRLIVIAVDGYSDESPEFAKGIGEQVQVMTQWLADPELDAQRRFEVAMPQHLDSVNDLREFLRQEDLASADYDEAVVLYITGHGVAGRSHRHYLTLPDTEADRLVATAFPTSELIGAVMDSSAEHILVLVDSCFSGVLQAELNTLLQDLSTHRRGLPTAAVVTSGDITDQPLVGEFCQLIALALERLNDEAAGFTASHLSYAEWEDLLLQVGDEHRHLIQAQWIRPTSRRRQLSPCLPNPGHRPTQHVVAPALRQLAMSAGPLQEYWLSRASGRAHDDDPGWYFSGRTAPMTAITRFLQEPAGVMAVTGVAGSGKSALLARVVTLTDPGFLEDSRFSGMAAGLPEYLRPAEGSVDAAMLARNKSSRAMVEDLLAVFSPGGADPAAVPLQELLRVLRGRAVDAGRPVTIVMDGLDEAEDPQAFVGDVVVPISRITDDEGRRCVRLLLGVRSSTAVSAGEEPESEESVQLLTEIGRALGREGTFLEIVRTDGEDCGEDIAAYVEALLTAPGTSPYEDDLEAARAASTVIADAVQPSFLDARLAADQLRTSGALQDLNDGAWRLRLSDGTTALLRADIKDVTAHTGIAGELLVATLRATAFAPGAGLPWAEVWPTVAHALLQDIEADRSDVEAAIRAMRASRLVGYLTTDEEDARTVYRPVHQRITEQLQHNHRWLLGGTGDATLTGVEDLLDALQRASTSHARIAAALADLVTASRRPHSIHPYIRRHQVHHAAAGGVLNDAHVPLVLLTQETSGSLRSHLNLPLPANDPPRRVLTAAALIEPYLDDTTDDASRQSSIAFHLAALAPHIRQRPPSSAQVRTSWAQWRARTNVLASPRRHAHAMTVLSTTDGRSLIAVGSQWGVEVWDAATGRQTAAFGVGRTVALCPIRTTGRRVFLVAAGPFGVGIWDPLSGQQIAHHEIAKAVDVQVLADGDRRWQVLVGTSYGDILRWRPDGNTVESLDGVPEPYGRRRCFAVVRDRRGRVLVAADSPEGVKLWDPLHGLVPEVVFGKRGTPLRSMTVVRRRGHGDQLVTTANGSGDVARTEVWDPFSRECIAFFPQARHVAAPPTLDGSFLAIALGNRITVWETSRDGLGHAHGFALSDPSIDALGTVLVDRQWRIVTAGAEGVRLWSTDAEGDEELHSQRQPSPANHSWRLRSWPMCVAASGSAVLLAYGTAHGIEVRHPGTGELVSLAETPPVLALQPLPSPPDEVLVAATTVAGPLTVDLTTGLISGLNVGPAALMCVAEQHVGEPLIVTSDRTSLRVAPVRDWTSTRINSPRRINALAAIPPAAATTAFTSARAVLVAAGTVDGIDIWDVLAGHPVQRLRVRGQTLSVTGLCALKSARGTVLAASAQTGIQFWDLADGTLRHMREAPRTLTMTAVPLPDGTSLLASGHGHGVRLWDPASGELLHTVITSAPVHALTGHLDGTRPTLFIGGPAGMAAFTLGPEVTSADVPLSATVS